MGKVVKTITKPAAILANPMIGLNALAGKKAAGALGINLDDKEGEAYNPDLSGTEAYNRFAQGYDKEMSGAEKAIGESGMTKGLFGQGGLNEQLGKEQQTLASQGFQLTPEDREAYGQASGDIARLFGGQEQQAAQALARRGLGAASSGAAGAAFSGLAGNKNEMLAKQQMQIANQRMENTRARLADTRNMMSQLGQQGFNMAHSRVGQKGDILAQGAGLQNQGNQLQRQAYQDKEANAKPGLFSMIGQGLSAGIGNLATQAPGMALGGLTGGAYGTASLGQKAAADRYSRGIG